MENQENYHDLTSSIFEGLEPREAYRKVSDQLLPYNILATTLATQASKLNSETDTERFNRLHDLYTLIYEQAFKQVTRHYADESKEVPLSDLIEKLRLDSLEDIRKNLEHHEKFFLLDVNILPNLKDWENKSEEEKQTFMKANGVEIDLNKK